MGLAPHYILQFTDGTAHAIAAAYSGAAP